MSTATCPYCGGEIEDTTITCPHCSSDVRVPPRRLRLDSMRLNASGAAFIFSGGTADDVAHQIDHFFVSQGFALEKGTKLIGVYGSGSAKGRALGGGFTNRQKFDVRIAPTSDGHVEAGVSSAMSGWSGSVMGVTKERRGRRTINAALEAYFTPFMRA